MDKVIIGMSGGVDSAVAALILKKTGYDVIGVTLRTWEGSDDNISRCCEIDDAQAAASIIGIPYYPLNYVDLFEKNVVKPFMDEYISGMTPSPCIGCNASVKWAGMLKFSDMMGAKYVATGHYAEVVSLANGRYTVREREDFDKDQTYMLAALSQEALSRTLMPLSGLTKADVRKMARDAALPVANKPDSQEICFVGGGKYADFIEKESGISAEEGSFVDTDGNILGRHKGIVHYTVGQRRGLGLPLGYHAYVCEIRPERNEIVIGDEGALMRDRIICGCVNYMSISGLLDGERLKVRAKVRYRHKGEEAYIYENGGKLMADFARPVRAPAPGQYAVFYDDEGCVVACGKILRDMQA